MVTGSDSVPLVVLDAWRPDDAESLDRAVRAAASLAFHIGGSSGCALLLPDDRRPADLDPGLAHWPAIHARLALVEESQSGPAPARAQRSGAVFWIAARASAQLPRLLRGGSAPRYLVVPANPGVRREGPVAFSVSGCDGIRSRGRAQPREVAA